MAGLYWTLLPVLATLTMLHTARAAGVRQAACQQNVQMDGLQLTAPALFQASARSAVHCGLQCSRLEGCRSFTFSADQPSSCRCYDVETTSSNANDADPAAGAKTFDVVIAGCPKTSCSEFPLDQSECFEGQCLCVPGYYYSTANNTCLADCPLAALGGGFVKYLGSRLLDYDGLYSGYGTSLAECQSLCLNTVINCRSFNYRADTLACYLKAHTARTMQYQRHNLTNDHYQRTCA